MLAPKDAAGSKDTVGFGGGGEGDGWGAPAATSSCPWGQP